MNIIEAIKSGKPFKREHWTGSDYICVKSNEYQSDCLFHLNYKSEAAIRCKEDIVANDWVILEKSVSISEGQFNEALKKIGYSEKHDKHFIVELKKELGF